MVLISKSPASVLDKVISSGVEVVLSSTVWKSKLATLNCNPGSIPVPVKSKLSGLVLALLLTTMAWL